MQTGGTITSVVINSGNTNTDWKIASALIVPNQNGGLNAGPYVLNCTFTNAYGSSTADITIPTSGTNTNSAGVTYDLAHSWSVSNITECAAALQSTALAFGDFVLLRTGTLYNPAQTTAIRPTAALVGTWTPPSLYDAAHPDKGYDLFTGNFVTVTKHTGASPIITRFRFLGNGGRAAQYTHVCGLAFNYLPLVPIHPVTNPFTLCAIQADNGAHTVAISLNDIYSETNSSVAAAGEIYSAVYVPIGPDWIQDNHIHDVGDGLRTGLTTVGSNVIAVGNDIERFWGNAGFLTPGDDCWYNWNFIHNVRSFNISVGIHVDATQIADATAANLRFRAIGNVFQLGDYPLVPTPPYDSGAQGLFGGPSSGLPDMEDAVVAGNLIVLSDLPNLLYLGRFKNGIVRNNTAVFDPASTTSVGRIGFNVGDSNLCQYNVGNLYIDNAPVAPSTLTPNITVAIAGYSGAFVNPASLTAITDITNQYANLPGSPADLTSPKSGAAGTGYVDYVNRETFFPWASASGRYFGGNFFGGRYFGQRYFG